MPEPFKNMFSREFVKKLAAATAAVEPAFHASDMRARVLDETWEARELKDRMRHIAAALYGGLPGTYAQRIGVLRKVAPGFSGLPALVFPDVVEQFGLDDWDTSLPALEAFTLLCSSEFAVRPFIERDTRRMMKQMMQWARHENEHVRRLASEGCRPRLPWGMALPAFKRDPSPVLPILEQLRSDPSEYVRRSVANNLNDIAKDHPALVLEIATRWLREAPETRRLVKHASRTLLKSGSPKAMALFGLDHEVDADIRGLSLGRKKVPIGDVVEFAFDVHALADEPVLLRLDYAIDFVNRSGGHSRKVFKLSERTFAGKETVRRRHPVRDLSIRTHQTGRHHLHIMLNGRVAASTTFELEHPR